MPDLEWKIATNPDPFNNDLWFPPIFLQKNQGDVKKREGRSSIIGVKDYVAPSQKSTVAQG